MKFDEWPDLQARQSQKPGCIEVTWKSPDTGLCAAFYEVNFKNASGTVLYSEMGSQITKIDKCGIADRENLTEVELSIMYGEQINKFRTKVMVIVLKGRHFERNKMVKIPVFYYFRVF